jgi:hypothetical protein
MQTVFNAVPVGLDGLYVIRRDQAGTQSYLAEIRDATMIGRYSKDLADRTVRTLTEDSDYADSNRHTWLPWHTDHLPYGRPMSMFPPSRASILT